MRKILAGIVFFAAAPAVFGQLDDNTLTITASRTTDLQPDQVVVGVYVDAPLNTGVDDILGALQGSGLTAADLGSVYTSALESPGEMPRSDWAFSLPVPFSKLKATLASLLDVQKKLEGMSMTFSVQGTQISPELQAAQTCSWAPLVGDARSQAQRLAAAAGLAVGPIIAISDGSGAGVFGAGGYAGLLLGQFSNSVVALGDLSIARVGIFSSSLGPPPPNCSMTVQFKLLH